MRIARKVEAVQDLGAVFEVSTDAFPIRVSFLTDDIVRIRAGIDGKFEECSYTLAMTAWDDVCDNAMQGWRTRVELRQAFLFEEPDCFIIKGPRLSVRVRKAPFVLEIVDSDGTILHRDIPDLGWRVDSNLRRCHTSEIVDGDCFYGFGESGGEINKARKLLTLAPGDTMGYDPVNTDPLYKHIPFYIRLAAGTKIATGYFYHTTAECDFDMGRSHSNYWKKHSTVRIDSGDHDLFFIAGPKMTDVVQRYTDLTGKSALLPIFALGYLGSSMYYSELPEKCDDEIVNFIDMVREEGIPIDGFQLSSGYCTRKTEAGDKRCVLTWNDERFPDPKAFFQRMKDRGIVVSPNVKPGVLTVNPLYDEMKQVGIFVRDEASDSPAVDAWWGGPGSFADFTKAQTREWWKKKLRERVIDMGTYSIWNDNCEFESLVNRDCRIHLEGHGGRIGHYKTVMSNLMCQITTEAIHEAAPDVRPFVVCRSGHSGIQRYAQTWAGDNLTCWEALKYNIATILGMGLSGQPNEGCDIGGFYGPAPEAELFVRWVQNGIFQPRFSIHSVNTDNTVTEPWMYRKYAHIIRDAIRFRYRLIPHLYSLERRAHETGLPIMSPLFLTWQDDQNTWNNGTDFMLGDMLVANVVEKGQTVREVYFPRATAFYDTQTGQLHEGGQTYRLPVTMESIPWFLRRGGMIAMAGNELTCLSKDKVTDMELLAGGGADGSYTLYEDDGVSEKWRAGDYKRTVITLTAGERTVLAFRAQGAYRSPVRTWKVRYIYPEKAPFWVELAGRRLPHYLHDGKFAAAAEGWYYCQDSKSVVVKFAAPEQSEFDLTISFEKFDMIGM